MPIVCSQQSLFSNFHSLGRRTIEFLPNVLTSKLIRDDISAVVDICMAV